MLLALKICVKLPDWLINWPIAGQVRMGWAWLRYLGLEKTEKIMGDRWKGGEEEGGCHGGLVWRNNSNNGMKRPR